MAFKQEINIPMVVTTGLVSIILLIVLAVGTQAWFESTVESETNARVDEVEPSELVQMKMQQAGSLNNVTWKDATKTRVTIPISRAMGMIVEQYANGGGASTQPTTEATLQTIPLVPATPTSAPTNDGPSGRPGLPDTSPTTQAVAASMPATLEVASPSQPVAPVLPLTEPSTTEPTTRSATQPG